MLRGAAERACGVGRGRCGSDAAVHDGDPPRCGVRVSLFARGCTRSAPRAHRLRPPRMQPGATLHRLRLGRPRRREGIRRRGAHPARCGSTLPSGGRTRAQSRPRTRRLGTGPAQPGPGLHRHGAGHPRFGGGRPRFRSGCARFGSRRQELGACPPELGARQLELPAGWTESRQRRSPFGTGEPELPTGDRHLLPGPSELPGPCPMRPPQLSDSRPGLAVVRSCHQEPLASRPTFRSGDPDFGAGRVESGAGHPGFGSGRADFGAPRAELGDGRANSVRPDPNSG
jgi:hypothetical protein